MPPTKAVASASGSLAAHKRHHPTDATGILERRRALAEARIAAYVERVLSEAPELTTEQRDRLAGLLRPSAGVS